MDTSETYIKMCRTAFPKDAEEGTCLKTQDQLQEMLGEYPEETALAKNEKFQTNLTAKLASFMDFVQPEYELYLPEYTKHFTSMEQLWLAFVMKEKYNKTWVGNRWVKAT